MEHNLAVLIDFENIAAGTEKEGHGKFNIRAVLRRLKDKGRILVSRAYGDWGRYAKFKQALLEQGVSMMELTSYRGQDKNRADIALVVDAMELAFTRDYIDTYVLLSGDSDFTPLVERLKELNKRVIGIGTRGSTSRLLIERCDEFIFYESIRRDSSRERTERRRPPTDDHSDQAETLDKDEAMALLAETVGNLQAESPDPVLAGLVKQTMKRKAPTFDETEYGYAGFARFLEAAQKKGLVNLARDSKAGGYRVDLPGSATGEVAVESEEDSEPIYVPFEGRAGELVGRLAQDGYDPLRVLPRHTVVHELVDHVQERQAKKKRNTLMYVYGDVARRCRKTDPVVGPTAVKYVIDALRDAGELRHSDGNPVRSPTAHFFVRKDAEELMRALRSFYVGQLLDAGEDLSDTAALSEVMWGDREHTHQVQELIAWVQHDRTAGELEGDTPTEVIPPTKASEVAVEEAAPAPEPAPEPEPAPAEVLPPAADDDDEFEPLPPEDEEPPKRSARKKPAAKKTSTRKSTTAKKTTTRKRSTTSKKAAEAEPKAEASEAAPAEEAPAEEAPKKKTTRRRRATKKTTEEAAPAEAPAAEGSDSEG